MDDLHDDDQQEMVKYREDVLDLILRSEVEKKIVHELRLSLFIRAANYHFNYGGKCLEPFPSCFFDPATKSRRYHELEEHLLNIPKLSDFTDRTSLPQLTWKLLYWIFTNWLDIVAVCESSISNYLTDVLRIDYNLSEIPYPSKICTRFDITHEDPAKRISFVAAKMQFGSFFAYHGSPSHNFHSIIHRGLISTLNVTSAYGFGTYLTSELEVAKSYARKNITTTSNKFRKLSDYRYSIAIVEVIKDPTVKVFNVGHEIKYFVVNKDELMRLRKLFVFEPSSF